MNATRLVRELKPIIGHTIMFIAADWLADHALKRHVGKRITGVRYLRPAERTNPAQNVLISYEPDLDHLVTGLNGFHLSAAGFVSVHVDEVFDAHFLTVRLATYRQGHLVIHLRPQHTPAAAGRATNPRQTDSNPAPLGQPGAAGELAAGPNRQPRDPSRRAASAGARGRGARQRSPHPAQTPGPRTDNPGTERSPSCSD